MFEHRIFFKRVQLLMQNIRADDAHIKKANHDPMHPLLAFPVNFILRLQHSSFVCMLDMCVMVSDDLRAGDVFFAISESPVHSAHLARRVSI